MEKEMSWRQNEFNYIETYIDDYIISVKKLYFSPFPLGVHGTH